MTESNIDHYVSQARSDRGFFDNLVNEPGAVLDGFEEIEKKVAGAIDAMSPVKATKDLLDAPSNDHCFKTSCGNSSFITD